MAAPLQRPLRATRLAVAALALLVAAPRAACGLPLAAFRHPGSASAGGGGQGWLEIFKYSVTDVPKQEGNSKRAAQGGVNSLDAPTGFTRVASVCSTCAPAAPGGGLAVSGADLAGGSESTDVDACAAACSANPLCVSFTWASPSPSSSSPPPSAPPSSQCRLHRYAETYTVEPAPGSMYFVRNSPPPDPTGPQTVVPYIVDIPRGSVVLRPGSALHRSMELSIDYLLRVYNVDEMLWWFRTRAGNPSPPGVPTGWDQCDNNLRAGGKMCLKGTVSSAFLMGAGGVLRWTDNAELRRRFDEVVAGVVAAARPDGFAAAYEPNETMYRENPSYVLSWLVHGLLEADVASATSGSSRPSRRPIEVARAMVDWFSRQQANPLLPEFLPADRTTDDVPSVYGNTTGHQIYLISQGIIHHTRMATGPLGRRRDVDVVTTLYEEDEWLTQLAAKNETGVWQKRWFPHNYEVTAFEAYLDMYVLTGNAKYLNAMMGAWEMFRESFIHVGGSMAINEGSVGTNTSDGLWYPPKSYYLEGDPGDVGPAAGRHVTGETCGSVFWILLNQRFHRLHPTDERFTAEIERSLVNVGIANQATAVGSPTTGIRYFALLHGHKEKMTNVSTCCEGQGSRLHGSLPEHVFSTSAKGSDPAVFVNQFAAASIEARLSPGGGGSGGSDGGGDSGGGGSSSDLVVNLTVASEWPYPADASGAAPVTVAVRHGGGGGGGGESAAATFAVVLRVPSWAGPGSVPVGLNGNASFATGTPGRYLEVKRPWRSGDVVSVPLRMRLKATRYVGVNRVAGSERFAFELGPTLLAAVPSSPQSWNNATNCLHLPHDPEDPHAWMRPVPGKPAHFDAGGGVTFVPYFEVNDELMTVFPCFAAATSPHRGGASDER